MASSPLAAAAKSAAAEAAAAMREAGFRHLPRAFENPYLWTAIGAFFLGAALGQVLRSFRAARLRRARAEARASALALCFLACAVASGAALLVLAPKAALADGLLPYWAGFAALVGLAADLAPRAAGIPLCACALIACFTLASGVAGWLPLSGPCAVARLFPYTVGEGRFLGELELYERDTVPTLQRLELPLERAALVVERLELGGPLALLAGARRYRVVGIAGPEGAIAATFPARVSLLDRLAALPAATLGEARGPFAVRRREASEALPLTPLEPIVFAFVADEDAGAGALVLTASTTERAPRGP